MMTIPTIDARQARHDVEVNDALLVCAYGSREKCEKYPLDGAMPLEELQAREDDLSRERELIFYCA